MHILVSCFPIISCGPVFATAIGRDEGDPSSFLLLVICDATTYNFSDPAFTSWSLHRQVLNETR
jgi:hypothetical protein